MTFLLKPALIVAGKLLALNVLGGCSDPGADQDVDGQGCNDLADGPAVSVALALNPPPLATGGTVSEGTYTLTNARMFRVPPDVDLTRKLSAVWQVKGNVLEQVGSVDGKRSHRTSSFTTSGTTLSTSDSCPASASGMYDFSATPTQLLVYSMEPGTPYTLERAFTKR